MPIAVAMCPCRWISVRSVCDDHDGAVDHQRAGAERHPAVAGRARRVRIADDPPDEQGAAEQEDHREQVVGDDHRPVQVEQHGRRAEQALRDHADPDHDRRGDQVAPERPHAEREHARGDAGEADDGGQQPVAVLDPDVRLELGQEGPAAVRPVRTAEAGAREPHPGTAEHDQHEQRERGEGHVPVRAQRQREAVPHGRRQSRPLRVAPRGSPGTAAPA
jgi:hypothetical protein